MSKPLTQIEKLQRYNELIRKQTGKVVRPARFDGYKNLLNKYGTSKDTTEHYFYAQDADVNDDQLTILYEGNGLFSKIIDAPAEEAVKHGFELKDLADQDIEAFYSDALDELDWEESAITAVKWARLFGGSIIVMLIDDGRGIEEPLDWKNIRSIDDMRVYERAIIQPDYTSMFHYEHEDPFRTRGSRLGMPERFYVTSRWGSFCVHESRCLVFQNGVLPENTSNSIYQIWGVPEYFRLKRALRDAEVAHGSATKLLDRSVQAVYKMKNLAEELATEEGEDRVLRRLQTIDMARGLLNSITIDAEGEEYDFRQFSYSGVSEVIDTTCNFLSALTSIPQTILFGRSPAGMNATGESDLENWYNYVERLQKRMLRSNLRYLLAIIFQAGINAGDIDEVPDIKVQFSPLWSMSDMEQADLDLKKVQIQQTRASIACQYIDADVLDPTEVRKKLADSDEFDIETMLDEYTDDELFPEDMMQGGDEEQNPMAAMMAQMGGGNQAVTEANSAEGNNPSQQGEKPSDSQTTTPQEELNPTVDIQERNKPEDSNAPASEPAATKLPQDKSAEEQKTAEENTKEYFKNIDLAQYDEAEVKRPFRADDDNDSERYGVGVYVVKNGKILCGTRMTDTGKGQVAGPGGHVHIGETPEQAAIRETEEEFGITPTDLMYIGKGGTDAYGVKPYVFLCTEYNGRIRCKDGEMADPKWITTRGLKKKDLFDPFASGINLVISTLSGEIPIDNGVASGTISLRENHDGGPGSGNHGHAGVPGQIGGSAPNGIQSVDDKYFPSGDNAWRRDRNQGWNKERDAYLSDKGFGPDKVKQLTGLIQAQIHAESDASERFSAFAKENPDFIKAVASFEIKAASLRKEDELRDMQKTLDAAKENLEEAKANPYNLSKEDNEWQIESAAEKVEYAETMLDQMKAKPITLYRKGDYEKSCLSFTTDRDGVILNKGSENESYLFPDHEDTLNDLVAKGIVPVCGFGAFENFYSGESSEVICLKIESQEEPKKKATSYGKTVERLTGKKTSDGVEIKDVSHHALQRTTQRRISNGRIEKALSQGVVSEGSTQGTRYYDYDGSRVVVNVDTGTIVTVMWRMK